MALAVLPSTFGCGSVGAGASKVFLPMAKLGALGMLLADLPVR